MAKEVKLEKLKGADRSAKRGRRQARARQLGAHGTGNARQAKLKAKRR